jgi:hypothetical protein
MTCDIARKNPALAKRADLPRHICQLCSRLKTSSGNDSCVLADSGFPFARQLNNKTRGLLDVHRGIIH